MTKILLTFSSFLRFPQDLTAYSYGSGEFSCNFFREILASYLSGAI
jgi:hypothetical protein